MNIQEILDSNVVNQISEQLKSALSKLGDGAEYVAGIFVKQQIVVGIQDLISSVVGITVAFVLLRNMVRWERKYRAEGFIITFSIIASIVILVFVLSGIDSVVGRLVNPEYYAIQDVMRMLPTK